MTSSSAAFMREDVQRGAPRAKPTNFELGTRAALIISCPWIAGTQGTHSTVFAELVDLFPT